MYFLRIIKNAIKNFISENVAEAWTKAGFLTSIGVIKKIVLTIFSREKKHKWLIECTRKSEENISSISGTSFGCELCDKTTLDKLFAELNW